MTRFANKSFNVSMRSSQPPDDLEERWRKTFGERMPKPILTTEALVRLADVYALLEREAEKSRLNGDLITADLFDLVRAKMQVLDTAKQT